MQITENKKYLELLIMKNKIDEILPFEVLESAELCRYSRDEDILVVNSDMPYFYFFVTGKLKVFQIHENGKAFLIQFYSSFDSLGEIELVNNVKASCSVSAVLPSELIRIPIEVLRQRAIDYPPFLWYVSKSLATKLLYADRHHSLNLLYPVKNRLASYLMAHEIKSDEIVLKDSLQDVSEFIGTTYRQLHRAFQQLEKNQVLKKTKKSISVLDLNKLELLAGSIYEEK